MISGRGRALPLLVGALALAACGSHVVGTLPLCCYDLASEQPVAACPHDVGGSTGNCRCIPELCGVGSVCSVDSDCPAPFGVCSKCDDGKTACVSARCVAGQCELEIPRCASVTAVVCRDDFGCSAPQACISCSDGSRSCYAARCVDGTCRVLEPACSCSSDGDCHEDNACTTCADGVSPRCLQPSCADGRCLVVAPTPGHDACPKPPSCDTGCKIACATCEDGSTVCGRAWCGDDGRCRAARPACPSKSL